MCRHNIEFTNILHIILTSSNLTYPKIVERRFHVYVILQSTTTHTIYCVSASNIDQRTAYFHGTSSQLRQPINTPLHRTTVLHRKWLVGGLGFINGSLKHYFSPCRAVSQRQRGRKCVIMIDENKIKVQTKTFCTCCKYSRLLILLEINRAAKFGKSFRSVYEIQLESK